MKMTYVTTNNYASTFEKAIKCANLIAGVKIQYTKENGNEITTFFQMEADRPYDFMMLGKFLAILEE